MHSLSNLQYDYDVQQWVNAAPAAEVKERGQIGEGIDIDNGRTTNCHYENQFMLKDCLITSLPPLPPQLKRLMIFRCPELKALPDRLPPSLTYLAIADCPSLKTLPTQLSPSLEHLSVCGCPLVTSLPSPLPAGLTRLSLKMCYITELPPLPSRLYQLSLYDCPELGPLLLLPEQLTDLTVSDCRHVTSLPPLPVNLETLTLCKWPGLTALPSLPDTLSYLTLLHCPQLTALPLPLPLNLISLHLTGSHELITFFSHHILPDNLEIIGYLHQIQKNLVQRRKVEAQLNLIVSKWPKDQNLRIFKDFFLSKDLGALWSTAEAKCDPVDFAKKQCSLLDRMQLDLELRQICFDLAGNASCEDGATDKFLEMQEQALEREMSKLGVPEEDLIWYGLALENKFKLEQLIEENPDLKKGIMGGEGVEAYLVLRRLCHQKKILLPVPVTAMTYPDSGWMQFNHSGEGNIPPEEIKFQISQLVGSKIPPRTKPEAYFLSAQPFWQAYMMGKMGYGEKIATINSIAEQEQENADKELFKMKATCTSVEKLNVLEIESGYKMRAIELQCKKEIALLFLPETEQVLSNY